MKHPRHVIRGGLLALMVAMPVAGWSQAAPAEDGKPRAADVAAGGADATVAGQETAPAAAEANMSTEGECVDAAGQAVAATEPEPSDDGMAPGNSGSTGWSGGTGGSTIGTNTQGALPSSKTWHAPTARGLDLAGLPEPADQPQSEEKPGTSDLSGIPAC